MAYNNSFELAAKFLPLLAEKYKKGSLTSRFDVNTKNINFVGSKTANVYVMNVGALAPYDRNKGFVDGNASGEWKSYELTQERGRSFQVDTMDNEETMGLAFGQLAGKFISEHVVPEIDAYRFATYAGIDGISTADPVDIGDDTNVLSMLDDAQEVMGDNEVPEEGRLLYVSEKTYKRLKNNITRVLVNEHGVNRQIEKIDNMEIIRVPKGRFNTQVTIMDEGFEATPGTGYPINFMIVHPSAVMQIVKHVAPRIFAPGENQGADAWKFQYRIYHDAFGMYEKQNGIYLSRGATANQ